MLDLIFIISVLVALAIIVFSALFFYIRNKKTDAKDSSETKALTIEIKPVIGIIKNKKKKVGKKGSQNESDIGSIADDVTIDNDNCDIPCSFDKKEAIEIMEEVIAPIKLVEENTAPAPRKRKNKVKQPSGDPATTDVRVADIDKNENQSNTLLGRSNEEKLKEEIEILQKKLDDLVNEKAKNEKVLKELNILIQGKETENESLKSDLRNASVAFKEVQDVMNEQKDGNKKRMEDIKSQTMKEDEAHKNTYQKYETKIEQLKADIKKLNGESRSLNSMIKVEMDKKEEIKQRFDEVERRLMQKEEELKTKNLDLQRFQDLNTSLKLSVEELQKNMSMKENEFHNKLTSVVKTSDELKIKIANLERDLSNKECLMGDITKSKKNLEDELSHLKTNVAVLTQAQSTDEVEKRKSNEDNIKIRREHDAMILEVKDLRNNNVELKKRLEDVSLITVVKSQELDLQRDAMVDHNVLLKNSVCSLEKGLNDKDVEIGELKKSGELLQDKLSSFTTAITELKASLSKKEEEKKQIQDNVDKLKVTVDQLKKEIEEKTCEIGKVKSNEELLLKEISSLREADGSMKKKIMTFEESTNKLNEQKTHYEIIVHDLNREMNELKTNNDSLTQKLSLTNLEIQELQRGGMSDDRLSSITVSTDVSNIKELNIEIENLTLELINLKEELSKKEKQVETLIQHTTMLVSDHKSIEKQTMRQTEELHKRILELEEQSASQLINDDVIVETTSMHVFKECPTSLSFDSDEVEKLKSHIMKLEKELIKMQGQYHVLKDDSLKFEDTEKRMVLLVNSEINVVDVPSDSDFISDNRSSDLHEAICRLNSEIEEQRLKNQKLQESCSLTQSENSRMKCQHDSLFKEHESLRGKYVSLEKKWSVLNETVCAKSNQIDNQMDYDIDLLHQENRRLKVEIEQYRDSLERTEQMLEKIQNSVDKEESNWTSALRSSEQDCDKLELKVIELSTEIEELRSKHSGDQFDMVASLSSLNNGTVSSENKKKRKRKNKKKRSKNHGSELNGN